jgi:D-inositol-3-phosphate glycosyltransferase
MSLRVAMLSVHTCPLAALGGKETGGMNVYVRELGRELSRMRVTADIFTRSQNPSIPRVVGVADGVRVVHLAAGPQAPMAREAVYDHLDEFVDRVETFRAQQEIDYDLIHGHYWLSGTAGLALRERWDVPLVQMFHTLGRLKNDATRDGAEREPDLRIAEETRIVGAADRLVAATAIERAHLVSHYGADPARIAVIPCGVDTTLFAPGDKQAARAALGLDDRPRLLYVGRLAPIKGLTTLLDGMARLRGRGSRAHLCIVGGDADEPLNGHEGELRARLADLGLQDAVTFVGAQPQESLRAWYVAADLTVLPSYYESFGMVALEAMACGSPVVASRVGGLQTTVRDRITGVLVPDHDPVSLADALEDVLDDAPLRARLGRAGVRWAAEHRWPCVAEAVCREYAALAAAAAPHLDTVRCQ